MATLAKNIKTDYQVINQIIVAVEPFIDELMDKYQASFEKNGTPFTDRDRQYFELAVITNLVKAVARYTDKNDKIAGDVNFKTSKGNVAVTCTIERNGETYSFGTHTIIAEGMIQQRHLRYLVNTSIRPTNNENDALKEIKEVEKAMKKEDRIKADIERTTNYITRLEKEVEELESKTTEQIEEEFYGWWIERFGKKPSFDMLNEQAQKHYETEEKYNDHIEKEKQEKFNQIKNRIRINKQYIKQELKTLQKYKDKLASI